MDDLSAKSTQKAFWKESASKGGEMRARKLVPEQRKEIARKAANIRWRIRQAQNDAAIPEAAYPGKLTIGDLVLPCAVLDNGLRVLSESGVTKALGGKRGGAHWKRQQLSSSEDYLPVFISANNLIPYMPPSLRVALSNPVLYQTRSGGRGYGVIATLLPEICNVWLTARRTGVLTANQEHIAAKAETLVSALANVGIIALVDEATGYQAVRDRDELHRILEAYISRELLPWTKRFPDEFYKELFRLRGWQYSPPQPKRPKFVGKLTNQLIYEKLPSGVLQELRDRNPVIRNGWRRHAHHQFLTENIGDPHLEKQLVSVTTLMRVSPTWATFCRLFGRAFPMGGIQQEFDINDGD